MRSPLISIIIVNWNGAAFISTCLESVYKQPYTNIEVIVVDNNSTDGSVKLIQSKFKKVRLVLAKKNFGFAVGCNIGYRHSKGKFVLLLNNDTTVEKDFLILLVSYLQQHAECAIVQPKIVYTGNPGYSNGTINAYATYFTSTGFLFYLGYGKIARLPQYMKTQKIFAANGACMLIRRDIIEEVGLFDDDFFMYFEETDFCIRVLLHGSTIVTYPKSTIEHQGGVSSRKYGTSKLIYHSFKNRMCSYIKNFQLSTLLLLLPLHLSICEVTSLLYLCLGKLDLFLAIQYAVIWNIYYLPQTLKKRRYVQSQMRNVSDDFFLSYAKQNPRLAYYLYLFKGLQYYND